jgi:hypothetical protein
LGCVRKTSCRLARRPGAFNLSRQVGRRMLVLLRRGADSHDPELEAACECTQRVKNGAQEARHEGCKAYCYSEVLVRPELLGVLLVRSRIACAAPGTCRCAAVSCPRMRRASRLKPRPTEDMSLPVSVSLSETRERAHLALKHVEQRCGRIINRALADTARNPNPKNTLGFNARTSLILPTMRHRAHSSHVASQAGALR